VWLVIGLTIYIAYSRRHSEFGPEARTHAATGTVPVNASPAQ